MMPPEARAASSQLRRGRGDSRKGAGRGQTGSANGRSASSDCAGKQNGMSAPTGLEQLFVAGRWRVDRAHSVVGFRVRHLLVRTVVGYFRDFDGVIATGETPSIVGTIRAASLETDRRARDERLRSRDFFDVEKYPELAFASRRVGFGAGGTMLLAGE